MTDWWRSYTHFGNNYWLLTDDNNFTQLLPYDQEDNYTPAWANWTTDTYFVNCSSQRCVAHPLTARLYGVAAQRDLLRALLTRFVRAVFGAPLLPMRVAAYAAHVGPFVTRDRWYGVDVRGYSGRPADYMRVYVPALQSYIAQRALSALA